MATPSNSPDIPDVATNVCPWWFPLPRIPFNPLGFLGRSPPSAPVAQTPRLIFSHRFDHLYDSSAPNERSESDPDNEGHLPTDGPSTRTRSRTAAKAKDRSTVKTASNDRTKPHIISKGTGKKVAKSGKILKPRSGRIVKQAPKKKPSTTALERAKKPKVAAKKTTKTSQSYGYNGRS